MLNGKHQATFPNILGLAGTELTCSIAAPMEMCFGFVTKTVLVIEILRLQLDRACTKSRISFRSPSSRQGVGNRPGGDSQEHTKYILESNQVHRHSTVIYLWYLMSPLSETIWALKMKEICSHQETT